MNSIGPYEFRTLTGNPVQFAHQAQVETRPGVPGAAVWLTGERGEPFTLRSTCGWPTLAQARSMYTWYRGLVGADPQPFFYYNLNLGNAEGSVLVLDVKQVELRVVARDTGGAVVLLVCEWTLIMV